MSQKRILNDLIQARKKIRLKLRALKDEEYSLQDAVSKSLQPVIQPLQQVAKTQAEELQALKVLERDFRDLTPKRNIDEELDDLNNTNILIRSPPGIRSVGTQVKPIASVTPFAMGPPMKRKRTYAATIQENIPGEFPFASEVPTFTAVETAKKTPTPKRKRGGIRAPTRSSPAKTRSRTANKGGTKPIGKGIFQCGKDIRYKLPRDSNKLVKRLRLLYASKRAGHTGHLKEISAIIRKLKRMKVIR